MECYKGSISHTRNHKRRTPFTRTWNQLNLQAFWKRTYGSLSNGNLILNFAVIFPFLLLSSFSNYVIGRDLLPNFLGVLLCTLIVMYLQCIFKFMNCFHVKTSLTYWVVPYSNESNIHCCFYIWAKGIRTTEKQSSRPLNVPMVLILFWALYEERDFHFHYQMVYTLPETMCTSTSSVTFTVSRPKQTHGIWREGISI